MWLLMKVKGEQSMDDSGRCPVCSGPSTGPGRVKFDVTKSITASGAKEYQLYLCGDCAEKEAKRRARVERERIAAAAVAKAMRS
jgi:hypothetical protein